ncbi:Bug family tripartite tricarboxylate transporter substrate binding protein [Hydrogenophaga sp. A37]|uniref:Bug family tripartite tricarboxylate transporter substrate binding protein n=1 Tax=Hydrogenophaga sp. A37 TaxID=1945864 RepID=UPI000984A2FC|nr:Bug family tripartite tricarboxylate transporter substrate binding protein [Hydrogenophaga sp. A37]OOG82537.1 twin-arginine translocation pathway signal protein [Hydrogenophaga sp. A37]
MTHPRPLSRRQYLQLSAAALASASGLPSAHAQSAAAPSELARIIIGPPPGTLVDLFARRVGEAITPAYARTVLVENKVGAASQIAVSAVKAAPADGNTILLTPMPMMGIFPHSYPKLPYDPVADFIPVSMGGVFDLAFAVGPMVPANVTNMAEFFKWCQQNPGAANFGSPAAGSTPHFAGSMAARAAGTELTHVPFRGTTPAILDMVGGQIAAVCAPLGDFIPFVAGGKCRLLATTGEKRSRFTPSVPTFLEQGYRDVVLDDWFGFFLPAKTPATKVDALGAALKTALNSPPLMKAMEERGLELRWTTSADLAARLKADIDKWRPIVKSFNFTAST